MTPIYIKLEKLDIIAQVLSELKEYSTEVNVDFVTKSVRAIGRCVIKVEQSAERCVSTIPSTEGIQTLELSPALKGLETLSRVEFPLQQGSIPRSGFPL